MTARRPRPERQARTFTPGGKADLRRREILDRAALLFSEVGYANASLEDVAAANGLSKSALYHYFRSRDEILFGMHEVLADDFLSHAHALRAAGGTAAERLRASMDKMLVANETLPGYVQAFFEHYQELPPDYRQQAKARIDEYTQFIEDLIVEGIKDGEFRPLPTRITTLSIFGMCNWANRWFRPTGPMTATEIARDMVDLVFSGLLTEPRAHLVGPVDGTRAKARRSSPGTRRGGQPSTPT